jgi:hypothetical protein
LATTKLSYSSATTVTSTNLASLASAAAGGTTWQSGVIDNSTDLALDALVQVSLGVGSGTIGNDQCAYVYAYGTIDGGTTYPDAITGSEGTFTIQNPTQLRLIGVVNMPSQSSTYKSEPMSVAAAFGGSLPQKWGLAIRQYCGIALNAATVKFQEVLATTA